MADIAWRIPAGLPGAGQFRKPSEVEREILRDIERDVDVAPVYISYVVGSVDPDDPDRTLPYASHWIESGWRSDPRVASGEVHINYASPPDAGFIDAAAVQLDAYITTHPMLGGTSEYDSTLVGVLLNRSLARYADEAVRIMKARLAAITYSRDSYNPNTNRRWRRSHALYNSIQAQRIV